MTTCSSYVIKWTASRGLTNLTIAITASENTSSGKEQGQQIIASGLDLINGAHVWHPINVPEGSYVLVGYADGLESPSHSPLFAVNNSSDTSCVSASFIEFSNSARSSRSQLLGVIIGPVVAAFFMIGIILAIIILCWKKRKHQYRIASSDTEDSTRATEITQIGAIEPFTTLLESAILTTHSGSKKGDHASLPNMQNQAEHSEEALPEIINITQSNIISIPSLISAQHAVSLPLPQDHELLGETPSTSADIPQMLQRLNVAVTSLLSVLEVDHVAEENPPEYLSEAH